MSDKEIAFDVLRDFMSRTDSLETIEYEENFGMQNQELEQKTIQLLKHTQVLKQHSQEFLLSQQEAAKRQGALTLRNLEHTYETLIEIKQSLSESLSQAKKGYGQVMTMYNVAFYLGIALIVTSAVFGAMGKPYLAIIFGAMGIADILTFFLKNPPKDLQTSRANYTQLAVCLTHWYSETLNWSTFYAKAQSNMINGQSFLIEANEIADRLNENTEKVLGLIEKYSEPHSAKANS